MNRRALMTSIVAAGAGAAATANASPVGRADAPAGVPKVVYHLSDLEKVQFVLGNVRNHIDGMGGADKVSIAVVVHGPPLRLLRAATDAKGVKSGMARLAKEGVAFFACANTMKGMGLSLEDLLPGFAVADKGGVVMLAELQGQGWLYLRP